MNMNTNAPCKDCKERTLGCHPKCTKYQDYNKIRQTIRKERRLNLKGLTKFYNNNGY